MFLLDFVNGKSIKKKNVRNNNFGVCFLVIKMEEDIAKCHFIPMSTMKRVLNLLENQTTEPNRRCKRNLLELQSQSKVSNAINRKKWRTQYKLALGRAVYSHDWDKLLFLLKKSPPWEHDIKLDFDFYIRALTILLMNHPSARAQGLLNDYLHMVLSCRSDEDKKAVLKVVLSLPKKIVCMNKH
ncbi:uncharacterized protein LOC126368496 [Pectinophora gossypiella]|uniref:uncharacterized protein LOC126368496 n=1 Tax=Pectinophora gossypiella TaxID=13191 RepID=UPI00214F2F19|nr:uncharacterized protein LOC126368496 [Pectinophora gossypiella]